MCQMAKSVGLFFDAPSNLQIAWYKYGDFKASEEIKIHATDEQLNKNQFLLLANRLLSFDHVFYSEQPYKNKQDEMVLKKIIQYLRNNSSAKFYDISLNRAKNAYLFSVKKSLAGDRFFYAKALAFYGFENYVIV